MITDTLVFLFPNYTNAEFNYWSNISTIKKYNLNHIINRLKQISKIKKKSNKYFVLDEYLDTLISELIDNSGCNFIIFNLPETHKNEILVTEEVIHDSFVPYGPIFAVHKYNDIAYLWFIYNKDAKAVNDSINNMQCEDNILQCQYMKSNLIKNNYDWNTKTIYETFNINGISLKLEDIDNYWKTIV